METRDDLAELSRESIIEKDDKGTNSYNFELCLNEGLYWFISNIMLHCTLDQMEVTEPENPDDATSKTNHLKTPMVISVYVVMNVNYLFVLNLL